MFEIDIEKARILFVDDSRLMRFAAQRFLRDEFDIVTAEHGAQAWELLQKDQSIRAVITDLMMPEVDGVELVYRIRGSSRENIRGLPVMVVTSVEESQGRKRVLDAGANDLLMKPFSGPDLIEPLHAYLRVSEARGSEPVLPANVEQTRGSFVNRLRQIQSFHRRHGLEFSLLHVRLDRYTEMIESLGLNQAEAMMRNLERVLAREARTEDTIGRSDTHVFSVALMATPRRGALRLIERLRKQLSRSPVRFPGHSVEFKVSISVQAPRPDDQGSAEDLLRRGLTRLAQPVNVTRLSERAACW
ncbi:MAG: response regulator [Wenzhouxiangellaceae bacterium]|nr:response regulator [Wenzhouxiangellaceae bacterium]